MNDAAVHDDPRSAAGEQGPFGLTREAVAALRAVLERANGVRRVWVFGSRARGDHRERSDLDLAIEAPGWGQTELLRLKDELQQQPIVYPLDVVLLDRNLSPTLEEAVERDRLLFWERARGEAKPSTGGGIELKEFQRKALAEVSTWLRKLDERATLVTNDAAKLAAMEALDAVALDAARDFPRQAWEQMRDEGLLPPLGAHHRYSARWTPEGAQRRPIPNACLKVPTGGGKTLLASAAVASAFASFYRRTTGLVLWVVPNEAIYRQTLKALRDRDHPYRQMLNTAGAGRVKVVEKQSPLSRTDVETHLVVIVLMLQSAARQSRETLRLFRDRGDVHGFFPREDDLDAHWAWLERVPNLDVYAPLGTSQEEARAQRGSIIKDSLGNVLRAWRPMVVIDEGHHTYTETALATIDGFNPSLVLELSATPRTPDGRRGHGSNILVDVRGTDLDDAEMIKLPINIDVRPWADWKSCLTAAVAKLRALDAEAERLNEETLRYIRPILLVQVERTGKEQRDLGFIHAEDARAHLKQLGLGDAQIAEKTSEKDELKQPENLDLLSPANKVQAIITKQALQEGWDCPFAYVLCALAAGRQQAALTQLVGRILRQPHTLKTASPALNECYVYCNDARTAEVIAAVKKSLEEEGMGDLASNVRVNGGAEGRQVRERRRPAALASVRIFLPRVSILDGEGRRELAYDSDILGGLDWRQVDVGVLIGDWAPDAQAAHEAFIRMGLEVLEGGAFPEVAAVSSSDAPLDRARIVRALTDVVPNPWLLWQWVDECVAGLLARGHSEAKIAGSSASLVEALRRGCMAQRDRLAEARFESLVAAGKIAFSLVADTLDYELPTLVEEEVAPGTRPLFRPDGEPVRKSLLQPVFESSVGNRLETEFACYLDAQSALQWWHRNVAKTQYGLQGWRRDKVYPDFVFAKLDADASQTLVVMETKGLQLKNTEDTVYKQRLLARLAEMYRSGGLKRAGELELVSRQGTRVVCDLVFGDEWRGALASRYFS